MEMHDDDKPIGRVLTRREALALLGGSGAVLAGAGFLKFDLPPTLPTLRSIPGAALQTGCIVRPEKMEGPYFVDEMLNRSDIRIEPSDNSIKPGAILNLNFRLSQLTNAACLPLSGAQVDVWHTDALGVYSDVVDPNYDTRGLKFLRGYQVTDADGVAGFTTIYPGWYPGRAVHIHFKIRTDPASDSGYEFTSQLFFNEALTDVIHAQEPYASHGYRDTLNKEDGIYGTNGDQLLLTILQDGDNYTATFDITLDLPSTLPDQPVLLTPVNGAKLISTDLRPTFTWTAVNNVTRYKLRLKNKLGQTAHKVNLTPAEANSDNSTCAYTIPATSPALQPGVKYTWFVKAINADGSAKSEPFIFKIKRQ